MSSSDHLPFEQLADFVEGRLAAEATAAVEAHLASGCALCSGQAAFLRRLFRAIQAAAWPAPPAQVHRRAVKAFRSLASQPSPRARRPAWGPLAAALAGVVLLIAVVRSLAPQAAYAAALTDVAGAVEVRLAPNAEWRPPVTGQTLPAGAEIRTAAGGQASLVFPGGDRLRLAANTHLTLTALTQQAGRWQIALVQASGRTQHQVGPDTARYQVQTPAGEAVAHGTRFDVQVEADGITTVSVSEGVVSVTTRIGSVTVSPGYAARLAPGSAPTLVPAGTATPLMTPSPPALTASPTASPVLPSPTASATRTPRA
ncbi:MAG: FecR domain-containing protein, partial [Chloroflexi bacterium]|nr:FecR domain-containing protein [Chloroflexota bacterium]